jgi:NAD(P)H-flavin reductase
VELSSLEDRPSSGEASPIRSLAAAAEVLRWRGSDAYKCGVDEMFDMLMKSLTERLVLQCGSRSGQAARLVDRLQWRSKKKDKQKVITSARSGPA